MPANLNKTVEATIDGTGGIHVVITHDEGYLNPSKITVTQGGRKVVEMSSTPPPPPTSTPMSPATPTTSVHTTVINTVPLPSGDYTVTVVCSDTTFTNTVTVPGGRATVQLARVAG